MGPENPARIGLLIGREWSWPSAFITEVNRRGLEVTADFVKIGGTFGDEPCPYAVVVDRMSHEIPYYRAYLKHAALSGCYVINDPFMAGTDDKFFGAVLGSKLGMRTPRTVALPNKRVETESVPESFRNLVYPMDWQGIIDYIGVPAILKDVLTGGRRVAHRVDNYDDLIRWYDESDTLTVVLQEIVESDFHYHAFVVGQEKVLVIRYSLGDGRYLPEVPDLDHATRGKIETAAVAVSRAYGYDINMIEFVVRDDEVCLINPGNPVPDLDINLLTPGHFSWCVSETADFAVRMAQNPGRQFAGYRWQQALSSFAEQHSMV